MTWIKIPDLHIRHVWIKNKSDDCRQGPDKVKIHPDWYEENGTPQCECGMDMVYKYTEAFVEQKIKA